MSTVLQPDWILKAGGDEKVERNFVLVRLGL